MLHEFIHDFEYNVRMQYTEQCVKCSAQFSDTFKLAAGGLDRLRLSNTLLY